VQERRDGSDIKYFFEWVEERNGRVICARNGFDTAKEAADAREKCMDVEWEPLVWEGTVDTFLTFNPNLRAQMYHPEQTQFQLKGKSLRHRLSDAIGYRASREQTELTAWAIGVWLADGSTGASNICQIKECHQAPHHAHTAVVDQLKIWAQFVAGLDPGMDEVPPPRSDKMMEDCLNRIGYDELNEEDLEMEEDGWEEEQSDTEPERKKENEHTCAVQGIVRFAHYSSIGNAAYRINMGSVFRRLLKEYKIFKRKKIPHHLLAESKDIRMALLAGIIDGDGHTVLSSRCFEIPAKHRSILEGVIRLSRSLGFNTNNVGKKITSNKVTGKVYTAYRVHISGSDVHQIRTVLTYKRIPSFAKGQQPNKDQRCNGFSIEKIDHAPYYGFELDGNRRCLLADFVVTHNSRQLSGIILDATLRGYSRKHCWFSVSQDLHLETTRDLTALGSDLHVVKGPQALDDVTKNKNWTMAELPPDMRDGVLFCTYSTLVSGFKTQRGQRKESRFDQIVKWCGGASFNGVLAFDECHRGECTNPQHVHQMAHAMIRSHLSRLYLFLTDSQKLQGRTRRRIVPNRSSGGAVASDVAIGACGVRVRHRCYRYQQYELLYSTWSMGSIHRFQGLYDV